MTVGIAPQNWSAPNIRDEVFSAHGDPLVIAHTASPRSVRNLRSSQHVCVAFIDVFEQTGFQLSGSATVIAAADDRFDDRADEIAARTGGEFRVHAAIVVDIEHARRVLAPSMRRPDADTGMLRSSTLARYGVRDR